jgi:hypothetical protein
MSSPLQHAFVPRLSAVAAEEYVGLSSLVRGVAITSDGDVRQCSWEDGASKLSSLTLYRTVVSMGAGCEFYEFMWGSRAPPKDKFFNWLLVQNHIQPKENLLKKHCIENDTCEICNTAVESTTHLIAGCSFSSGF